MVGPMKFARALMIVAAGATLAASASAGEVRRPVVVELFTSQGCSSCPPADELLGRLAERRGVLAISLPITYWDMLGWKDTLASSANTHRQKAYAAAMGHGAVYTPQIIVDGVNDVVGSREGDVEAAIAKRQAEIEVSQARREAIAAAHEAELAAREAALAQAEAYRQSAHAQVVAAHQELVAARRATIAASREGRTGSALAVPVSVTETPHAMHIAIGSSDEKSGDAATVWLFHLRHAVTVSIGAGENQGHTMTYRNVVGDLRPVGQWNGDAVAFDLPRERFSGMPHDAVAVVVQQAGYGRVVGATLLSHPDYEPSR
jgi:hypothetical protein